MYKINEWFVTDPDSQQWVKEIGVDDYRLIEMSLINPETHEFEVYTDDVDVDQYLDIERGAVNEILRSYGYGDDNNSYPDNPIQDVMKQYPNASQIIAECIFEYYNTFYATVLFQGTKQECINYIHSYIKSH